MEDIIFMFRKIKEDELILADKQNINALNHIHEQIVELNRRNRLMQEKYRNDKKYARIHKRLKEKEFSNEKNLLLEEVLKTVKLDVVEKQ